MVDAVVTVFLEKLLNTLSEQSRFVNEFRDQFKRLEKELQLMQCFLKDADRHKRKSKNETLRQIMANLRELIYEAEDILADCQLQSQDDDQLSNSWLNCIYPPNLQFQYGTGKRLREINEKITHIKDDISSLLNIPLFNRMETNDICNGRSDRWSGPVYDHTQVVGLEGDTRKIKDWLIEAEEGILAIGVVGMGGLGKTTIAQMVFNDREMENRFERRMWVSVSQTFTQEQIMRSMLRTLGDASVGDDGGELLRKISLYLSGKRYLLVMDDVWSENTDWWQRIHEGLPKGKGSSIIITTRNEKVAQRMGVKEEKVHRPRFLSSDDSWLLFRKIAFAATGGECMYPLLQDVGREIVEKCQGLPLAIKAVGGMMLYKAPTYPEWRRTANNFLDELSENDGSVMASLQLSYDELPSYLKSCFLSFSLYPEDCVITKEQLVHWWIGEGFVPVRNGRSSIEAGEDCFSGLTNRCLVEVVDKTYNKTISTCKIHDMVRDLVIKAAEEDAFFRSNGMSCRHLGIKSEMQKKQLIGNSKLRALLSTTKSAEVNNIASSIATKFSECCYLRVLDLSRSIFEMPLKGLLNQIGSLQHLTCLSLSNTHPLIQLPPSLEKLNNLQILDVSYCQNLKMLPPYIVSFKKLRVLDVSHCGSLEYVPKGLAKLSNLEVLLGFRPARSNQFEGCRISELRNLTRLRTLGLQFTCGDEIGGDEVNALINLNELQFLSISCFDSHGSDLIAKVDKLYPPQQLDELSLSFYPGKTSPIWLNPASLPMLRYLSVSSGNIESMHESFWGENNTIWKIEALMFESLSDLGLYWVELQEVMPSLRIVNATWCPELHSFPIEDVGFRGGVWIKEEQNMHM
ncbi:disease resistance RPP13-like protein 4 [Pistacia vera]|uniref:disease resistance RPP13-like protein 4 n=1 Tax=Pistacia vera TaxID=55513 RepID=UPI001262F1DB|nr:disease resistance RPP13-like protein 4 [Pistacia vera]